jgi:hypothetical protein
MSAEPLLMRRLLQEARHQPSRKLQEPQLVR